MSLKVTILVENTSGGECNGEHGLSFLIEYKNKLYLLDAGSTGMFAKNAALLNIDLSKVDAGFLSHAHYDHSGGFPAFFEENKTAKIYLQKEAMCNYYFKIAGPLKKYIGIPKGYLEKYRNRFEFVDGYKDFGNGIHILPHQKESAGKIEESAAHSHMCAVHDEEGKTQPEYDNFLHEQTVVFEEEDGLVCFNSCSHAGVDLIIQEIKKAFPDKKIKAFLGGFHMMGITGAESCSYNKEEVQAVAENLKNICTATFYSGHCTGSIAYEWLKEVLGDRLAAMCSGKVFLL